MQLGLTLRTVDSSSREPTDRVYYAIKKLLGSAAYAPGEYIREAQMARELGVSRTPLREAFRRLSAEGWLERIPNHGVRVKGWSVHDLEEIYDARVLIEPYLTGEAAASISAEQINALRTLACVMRTVMMEESSIQLTDKWVAANEEFHQIILSASGNARLHEVLIKMKEILLVKRTFNSYDDEERKISVQQHFELVDALEMRDSDWAAAVMKSHILRARRTVLTKLAQQIC